MVPIFLFAVIILYIKFRSIHFIGSCRVFIRIILEKKKKKIARHLERILQKLYVHQFMLESNLIENFAKFLTLVLNYICLKSFVVGMDIDRHFYKTAKSCFEVCETIKNWKSIFLWKQQFLLVYVEKNKKPKIHYSLIEEEQLKYLEVAKIFSHILNVSNWMQFKKIIFKHHSFWQQILL